MVRDVIFNYALIINTDDIQKFTTPGEVITENDSVQIITFETEQELNQYVNDNNIVIREDGNVQPCVEQPFGE